MNVLHSRYRQVPATVTLETLGKIAVIVDYYQIHEALLIMAPLWIKALLERQPPKVLGRDLILWIVVSWVFRDGAVFRVATKVAILRTRKDLEIPRDLPIPSAVIGKCSSPRINSMLISIVQTELTNIETTRRPLSRPGSTSTDKAT